MGVHTCAHSHLSTHTCMCAQTHAPACRCKCPCAHACAHMYVHGHLHVCMHTCAPTHVHVPMHEQGTCRLSCCALYTPIFDPLGQIWVYRHRQDNRHAGLPCMCLHTHMCPHVCVQTHAHPFTHAHVQVEYSAVLCTLGILALWANIPSYRHITIFSPHTLNDRHM